MQMKHDIVSGGTKDDPVATLRAQISARTAYHQRYNLDCDESVARSIPLTFCDDSDVARALDDYYREPVIGMFSATLANLLLQAVQTFVATLNAAMALDTHWHNTSAKVVAFESLAFLWNKLSANVRDNIRHEFEDDRLAVAKGVLGGFNTAVAVLARQWPGFSPEKYALSRILIYPSDPEEAADCVCRLILRSVGLTLPLLPGEARKAVTEAATVQSAGLLIESIRSSSKVIGLDLTKTISNLVAHYLEHRHD
jgi:hypothetical protein